VVEIKEYIESGVLEAYVIGSASEQETRELLQLKKQHPEIQSALDELEVDMERIASYMAVMPPPAIWGKIDDSINDLIVSPDNRVGRKINIDDTGAGNTAAEPLYINVDAQTTHMRIHKAWRWVFAAVFILGKIFLGFAIYFYLENRQAQQQIQELKLELRTKH